MLFYLVLMSCSFFMPLHSVLDGWAAPIYLENRYTFTNYEFARGHVYFKDGFDLPVNGTVVLNLLDPVEGVIQANRSTMLLQNDLILGRDSAVKGYCFVRLNSNILEFTSDQYLASTDRLFLTLDGEIRGLESTILDPGEGAIIFCGTPYEIRLSNFILQGPNNRNFISLGSRPTVLTLSNMSIILQESLILGSPFINLNNISMVTGLRGSEFICSNRIVFGSFATINIGSGIGLKVRGLGSNASTGSGDPSGGLILDNASLEYYGTPTSQFVFVEWTGGVRRGAGRITFKGPSRVLAPSGTQLFLTPDSIFVFEAGARCILSPETNIRLY